MSYKSWVVLAAVALVSFTSLVHAEDTMTDADRLKLTEDFKPHMVYVDVELQYDKGEEPRVRVGEYYCSNCGTMHATYADGDLIEEERALELVGFLLENDIVVIKDLPIHPRFIETIIAHKDGEITGTSVVAYSMDETVLFLKLDEPLAGTTPIAFNDGEDDPKYTIHHVQTDGQWITTLEGVSGKITATQRTGPHRAVSGFGVVLNAQGEPIGFAATGKLHLDGRWRGTPYKNTTDRIWATGSDYDTHLANVEEVSKAVLPHVKLNFRSPRKSTNDMFGYGDDEADLTELDLIGVVFTGDMVLIPYALSPKATARLERIRVIDPQGEAHEAQFVGSLEQYGALVAKLDQTWAQYADIPNESVESFADQLLFNASVYTAGDQRIQYIANDRLTGFTYGYRGMVDPEVTGDTETTYMFTPDGQLVVLPLAKREKVEQDSWRRNAYHRSLPAKRVAGLLEDLDAHLDLNNVPLSEEEEARLAWMGVVLQPLDQDLARMNEVADRTDDGSYGALVTFVYPGSPAEAADVQPGDILIQLHTADEPKPIQIEIMDEYVFSSQPFPWDRLDELPEAYYDRFPTPWPSQEGTFTRLLTDLGFGTEYEAEFIRDGELVLKTFEVTQSPPHYETANRYKSEELGFTARDMTFEVRRQIQKTDDDPGVVITNLEPGSKASVAGIKPFELITEVNGQAIYSAEEFQQHLEAASGELKLSINRLTQTRQVMITLDDQGDPEEAADE